MKYLCDACERLVDLRSYQVIEGRLSVTCLRCGARSFPGEPAPVNPARPSTAESAQVIPLPMDRGEPGPAAERCPKCAALRSGIACARCGLVFELYRPEADLALQAARADFERIMERWGDGQGLREVLASADPDKLAALGGLFRRHLADRPGDARAEEGLRALAERGLALAAAMTSESRPATAPPRGAIQLAVATMLLAIVAVSFYLLLALR